LLIDTAKVSVMGPPLCSVDTLTLLLLLY